MHFFYLDESGCTGANLSNQEQPIFVLGGICVKAQGWRETTESFNDIVATFFGGKIPAKFELHADDLLNKKGAFSDFDRAQRNALANELLDLVIARKHAIHFVALDKKKMAPAVQEACHPAFDCSIPYLLAFNYMVTYIERYTKEVLGRTVRGMIILDEKQSYHADIDAITHFRRYQVAKARRLKWLVEFSYPVDSIRHPMIQLSDLIIFLARKFLEMDNGYRPAWPDEAKAFYAGCYAKIIGRVKWTSAQPAFGPEEASAAKVMSAAFCTHRRNWRKLYQH